MPPSILAILLKLAHSALKIPAVRHGPNTKWKQMRTSLNPAFSPNSLRIQLPIIQKHTTSLVDALKAHIGQDTDMLPVVRNYTLNLVSEAMFGYSKLIRENLDGAE